MGKLWGDDFLEVQAFVCCMHLRPTGLADPRPDLAAAMHTGVIGICQLLENVVAT